VNVCSFYRRSRSCRLWPVHRQKVPKYSLHKATGQAVCWVNRKPRYLGKYNSPESRTAYAALLDELSLSAGMPFDAVPGDDAITINRSHV
jgi:hypothetical protein